MKPALIIVLALVLASTGTSVVVTQVPAGEVAEQVPVVEGVEKPDSPNVDEAEGNAEARMPQARPGSAVQQPQVEVPPMPQQPKPQQD